MPAGTQGPQGARSAHWWSGARSLRKVSGCPLVNDQMHQIKLLLEHAVGRPVQPQRSLFHYIFRSVTRVSPLGSLARVRSGGHSTYVLFADFLKFVLVSCVTHTFNSPAHTAQHTGEWRGSLLHLTPSHHSISKSCSSLSIDLAARASHAYASACQRSPGRNSNLPVACGRSSRSSGTRPRALSGA